ncbi:MAG: ATP-binding cassette domain-containing protein [Thermoplasmatales archaeon]
MEDALVVKNLKTQFFIYEGVVKAIDDVSFVLRKGEILGLVGETGCGKSVTAFSIMKLIPDPPGRIVGGEIYLGNLNLMKDVGKEVKIIEGKRTKVKHYYSVIKRNEYFFNKIRGKYISMIFQEPMAALNPVYTIEDQIIETLILHNKTNLLRVVKAASEHIGELREMAEKGEINYSEKDDLGNELSKIKDTESSIEAIKRHLNFLEEAGSLYLKHKERYQKMLSRSEELDKLEERLLSNISEEEKMEIIKILSKEAKKNNLIRMSKKLKRSIRDPVLLEARREALLLLESVEIPNAYGVLKQYPHELSGGMLQRAMISIALANNPRILLADEPTTALDVTVQAQILRLIKNLQNNLGTSIILITHDLGVIAETCDRVAVMYAGNIVETATTEELFKNPKHPYTIGLLQSIPRVDDPNKVLKSISGNVPNLINPPSGCRFHPRCPFVFDRCKVEKPETLEVSPGHTVACHLFYGRG